MDKIFELLGHCGCGQPSEHLSFILKALEIVEFNSIDLPEDENGHTHDIILDKHDQEFRNKVSEHFGTFGAFTYFMQDMDKQGFTTHGSNVAYGWLDDEGKELLRLLREWKASE